MIQINTKINIQLVRSIIKTIVVYIIHTTTIFMFFIISVLGGSLVNVEALADDSAVKSIKSTEEPQQEISNQNTISIGSNINATNTKGIKTSVVNTKDSSETIAENIAENTVNIPKITEDTNASTIESNISSTDLNPNNQYIQLIQTNQPTNQVNNVNSANNIDNANKIDTSGDEKNTKSLKKAKIRKGGSNRNKKPNKNDTNPTTNSDANIKQEDPTTIQKSADIPYFSDFPIKQPINGISFADNEQIKIVLSNRDINRISVSDDKIQSINGPTGFYTAKNDLSGSAYIGISTDATFTLFASTVNGHQISLLVTPRRAPGRTIVLNPTSPPLRSSTYVGVTEGYQKSIIAFVSGMINNEVLPNYSYLPAKKPKSYDLYKMMTIKPLGYYMGSNFVGVVSEVRNKTNHPIIVKPSDFYVRSQGTRAIALSEETLAPKASTLLYQIYSR